MIHNLPDRITVRRFEGGCWHVTQPGQPLGCWVDWDMAIEDADHRARTGRPLLGALLNGKSL